MDDILSEQIIIPEPIIFHVFPSQLSCVFRQKDRSRLFAERFAIRPSYVLFSQIFNLGYTFSDIFANIFDRLESSIRYMPAPAAVAAAAGILSLVVESPSVPQPKHVTQLLSACLDSADPLLYPHLYEAAYLVSDPVAGSRSYPLSALAVRAGAPAEDFAAKVRAALTTAGSGYRCADLLLCAVLGGHGHLVRTLTGLSTSPDALADAPTPTPTPAPTPTPSLAPQDICATVEGWPMPALAATAGCRGIADTLIEAGAPTTHLLAAVVVGACRVGSSIGRNEVRGLLTWALETEGASALTSTFYDTRLGRTFTLAQLAAAAGNVACLSTLIELGAPTRGAVDAAARAGEVGLLRAPALREIVADAVSAPLSALTRFIDGVDLPGNDVDENGCDVYDTGVDRHAHAADDDVVVVETRSRANSASIRGAAAASRAARAPAPLAGRCLEPAPSGSVVGRRAGRFGLSLERSGAVVSALLFSTPTLSPDTLSSALFAATDRAAVPIIRQLVRRGAPIDSRDAHGWTPLAVAAHIGHRGTVAELLTLGASPAATTESGAYTPLHLAAVTGGRGAVELLLGAGADPNARDAAGRTPFLHVCSVRMVDGAVPVIAGVLLELLRGGADPTVVDNDGNGALELAVLAGNVQPALLSVVAGCGAVCVSGDSGDSALSYLGASLRRGSDPSEAISVLLKAGADPNARLPCTPRSPRSATVVAQCMRLQAHASAALLFVAGARVQLLIDSLVRAGGGIDAGAPILHAIAASPHRNLAGTDGLTLLARLAAARGRHALAILRALLRLGLDASALGAQRETPLHTAARLGRVDAAKQLLKFGADPLFLNARGQSARTLAAAGKSWRMRALLRR